MSAWEGGCQPVLGKEPRERKCRRCVAGALCYLPIGIHVGKINQKLDGLVENKTVLVTRNRLKDERIILMNARNRSRIER